MRSGNGRHTSLTLASGEVCADLCAALKSKVRDFSIFFCQGFKYIRVNMVWFCWSIYNLDLLQSKNGAMTTISKSRAVG